MDFNAAFSRWCCLSAGSRILIITDSVQQETAQTIAGQLQNDCDIALFSHPHKAMRKAGRLSSDDLLLVLLSLDSFIGGAGKFFSPFHAPEGIAAKYIFCRLDISCASLLQGLATPKALVYAKISEMAAFEAGAALRVTNGSGTDITLQINPFVTCSHEITNDFRCAFLPPSETSSDVIAKTANGTIAVDVTVGQLYYRERWWTSSGLCPRRLLLPSKTA